MPAANNASPESASVEVVSEQRRAKTTQNQNLVRPLVLGAVRDKLDAWEWRAKNFLHCFAHTSLSLKPAAKK